MSLGPERKQRAFEMTMLRLDGYDTSEIAAWYGCIRQNVSAITLRAGPKVALMLLPLTVRKTSAPDESKALR